jgi:hypothetical protein
MLAPDFWQQEQLTLKFLRMFWWTKTRPPSSVSYTPSVQYAQFAWIHSPSFMKSSRPSYGQPPNLQQEMHFWAEKTWAKAGFGWLAAVPILVIEGFRLVNNSFWIFSLSNFWADSLSLLWVLDNFFMLSKFWLFFRDLSTLLRRNLDSWVLRYLILVLFSFSRKLWKSF